MRTAHSQPDRTPSFGAVVFRRAEDGLLVLMIKTRRGWSFPKGHREPGETPEQTALREVFEETGVRAKLRPGVSMTVPSARPGDQRTVTFFLGWYQSGSVTPQLTEVSAAAWVPAEQAADRVAYPQDRACLTAWQATLQQEGEAT